MIAAAAGEGSRPRIGFVIEQTLGHVAYGMSLRAALAHRTDFEPVWIDVPFLPTGVSRLPLLRSNWTLRGSLVARRLIAQATRAQPLDAIFLHTQTVSLLAAGIMSRVPTLLSLDATPRNVDELASGYRHAVGGASERLKRKLHARVVRRARAYTTWSEWAKRSLVADYGAAADRVVVVHPGTVVSRFERRGGPRREGPIRLLFVGGDLPRKGADLLLDVFKSHFTGSCELHVVTGTELPPAPGLHVHRGLEPYADELLELYRDADLFVLPTRADCLAVVLGEAMAASLPVITTRVGGHAEAVEDGESGYVIDPDDPTALRDRIERLVADPVLRARMGARGRAIAEARFDAAACAGTIADTLLTLAGARKDGAARDGALRQVSAA